MDREWRARVHTIDCKYIRGNILDETKITDKDWIHEAISHKFNKWF